uniref:Uncharacterized protein n=1 Tax=Anguilla anguilla TaxID=7936 RepID=A0A0E9WFV4_ANGAN
MISHRKTVTCTRSILLRPPASSPIWRVNREPGDPGMRGTSASAGLAQVNNASSLIRVTPFPQQPSIALQAATVNKVV